MTESATEQLVFIDKVKIMKLYDTVLIISNIRVFKSFQMNPLLILDFTGDGLMSKMSN